MGRKNKEKREGHNIFKFIEDHFSKCILALLALAIITPFLVWLLYSLPPKINTAISADGLLAYICSSIGGIITFVTIYVSIKQAEKTFKDETQRLKKEHEADICPRIFLALEKDTDFTLKMWNVGSHIAIDILLFETRILPYLKPGEEQTVRISFTQEKNAIFINPLLVDFTDQGYPKEIVITFGDIENNNIQQTFRCCSNDNNLYEPNPVEHL